MLGGPPVLELHPEPRHQAHHPTAGVEPTDGAVPPTRIKHHRTPGCTHLATLVPLPVEAAPGGQVGLQGAWGGGAQPHHLLWWPGCRGGSRRTGGLLQGRSAPKYPGDLEIKYKQGKSVVICLSQCLIFLIFRKLHQAIPNHPFVFA